MAFMAALPAIAGVLGRLFGGGASGAADERTAQNDAISRNNQAQSNLYGINQNAFTQAMQGEEAGKLNRANLDLGRQQFSLNAPSTRARQGLNADVLANWQPATMSGLPDRISSRMPTINGGAQLGPQGQLLARLIRDNAITGMQKGDRFSEVPETNFRSGILTPPTLGGYQQPGRLESILSTLGLIASGVGGLGGMDFGGGGNPKPPYHNPDYEDD
jgi:hypothetical protein